MTRRHDRVRRTRGAVGVVAAAGLLVAAGGAAIASGVSGPAATGAVRSARPGAAGTPGYCPTKSGVTVVVDFKELGGGIVVRCAPGPVVPGYTGLDALQDAGFTPEGVRRYGFAFICRIAGEPAPDQKLPIHGDPNYREACVNTPPPTAFWGYWYAPNKGSWTYSSVGALNRDAIPGGFEGWSFSLNHSPDTAPPPGIPPKRPPHQRPTSPPPTTPTHHPPTHRPPTHRPPTSPPTRPPTHRPPSGPPSSRLPASLQPHSHPGQPADSGGANAQTAAPSMAAPTSTAGAGGGSGRPARHPVVPTPTGQTSSASAASQSTAAVSNPVALGHNAAGEKVSGELPHAGAPSDASARNTALGVGLIAVLAAGGGFAAWRRRTGRG